MPSAYYTQDATAGTEKRRYYATRPSGHNHPIALAFTQKVNEHMTGLFPGAAIRLSPFQDNQSKIPAGSNTIELKYKASKWQLA